MARAVAGRADVLKAIVAYDQAEADLRGELARQYPAVSLGPGYTWERGLVKLPFAINLTVPSFDLNRAAIRAAEARRAQAGAAIETTLAQAQAAIESARAERAAAAAALDRVRRTELPQTEAVARRADAQLAKGAVGARTGPARRSRRWKRALRNRCPGAPARRTPPWKTPCGSRWKDRKR
jgi:CRISPR system Cascade subunit CasA